MKSKLKKLILNLKKMKKVAIAFSGGLDSSFLTKIAYAILCLLFTINFLYT